MTICVLNQLENDSYCQGLQVSNSRGGSDKKVDWDFCPNLISGQVVQWGGWKKKFICVGEKTKRMEMFLNINIQKGSNNSRQDGKSPENY